MSPAIDPVPHMKDPARPAPAAPPQARNPFARMLTGYQRHRFFGRHGEIKLIIDSVSAPHHPKSLVFQGMRTIGKTTLLRHLCDPYGPLLRPEADAEVDSTLAPVYVDCYLYQGAAVFVPMLRAVLTSPEVVRARVLDAQATPPAEGAAKADAKAALAQVLETLADHDVRVVFCVDHFDRAFVSLAEEDDRFMRALTEHHAFVIATEQTPAELQRKHRDAGLHSSAFLNILTPRNLGLLSTQDAHRLLTEPLRGEAIQFTARDIAFLLDVGGRHPYLLTICAELLFERRRRAGHDQPEVLPEAAEARAWTELEIASRPSVAELFALQFKEIDDGTQRVFNRLAAGEFVDPLANRRAVETLLNGALIRWDAELGRYRPYTSLLRSEIAGEPRRRAGLDLDAVAAELTPLDRKLLAHLRQHAGEVCAFGDLLEAVWGDRTASKRGLEAAVHRLRGRLAEAGDPEADYIQNVRGRGYRLVLPQ